MNFDAAIELMRKYGFSSTSIHPFIYKKGDTIGICYSYVDDNYGILERVKFFDSLELMEEFLKKITWVKANGKVYNVRMILDNYETVDPKVIFLRNEKIMVKGEMEDIEGFEARAAAQAKMDEVSKVILQAGNLLLVYEDLKTRQMEYYSSVIKLRNEVRQKYFELQTLVDDYNGVKKNKEVKLLPDINDTSGINIMMESSAKDRYNQYKVQHPTLDEAKSFVKDVWDLNSNLESNISYYEKQAEENSIKNEMRIVDAKLEYMKSLLAQGKTLFKANLKKEFKKINEECNNNSVELSNSFIQEKISNATKKYSYYEQLDLFKVSDYLRESIQNTNYGDLAIKYAKVDPTKVVPEKPIVKLPLNEIAADLTLQYNDKLNNNEQSILTLYNSKYNKLFNMILDIKDFSHRDVTEIIKLLNENKDFSKVKSECFDNIYKRLILPLNSEIKNKYFANISFDSFEMFIKSIVNELKRMKSINNKMLLNSDLNMYFHIENTDLISSKYFIHLTNDINGVVSQIKDSNDLIALTLLKQDTPVLYSPYYIDFGDLYNKDDVEIKVKNVSRFELLVDTSDVLVNVDENVTKVVKYYSSPKTIGNISVVDDIQMSGQNIFCKLALVNNLANKEEVEEFVDSINELNKNTIQPAQNVVQQVEVPVQSVQTGSVQEQAPVAIPAVPVEDNVNNNVAVLQQNETKIESVQEEQPVISTVIEPVEVNNTVIQNTLEENNETVIPQVEVKPVEDSNVSEEKVNEVVNQQSVDNSDSMKGLMGVLQSQAQSNNNDELKNTSETSKEEVGFKIENNIMEQVVKTDDDDSKFLEDLLSFNTEKVESNDIKDDVVSENKNESNTDNVDDKSEDDKFLEDLLG
ncbi:MAG: hypothetical protein ACI4WW_08265 [Candidatus Coprovivens sp.]